VNPRRSGCRHGHGLGGCHRRRQPASCGHSYFGSVKTVLIGYLLGIGRHHRSRPQSYPSGLRKGGSLLRIAFREAENRAPQAGSPCQQTRTVGESAKPTWTVLLSLQWVHCQRAGNEYAAGSSIEIFSNVVFTIVAAVGSSAGIGQLSGFTAVWMRNRRHMTDVFNLLLYVRAAARPLINLATRQG
jgi:hypothetical protein